MTAAQRVGDGFRSFRAMFSGGDEKVLSVESFLVRLVRAVRNDDESGERSSREVYVTARKRRRRLGLIAFGAGPFVGVANQVADLYCETATFCDVAALRHLHVSDEAIAASSFSPRSSARPAGSFRSRSRSGQS